MQKSTRQRLEYGFGIILDCTQERSRRPRGLAAPLFPIAQRSDVDVEDSCELRLAQMSHGTDFFHGYSIDVKLSRWRTLTASDLAVLLHALDQPFKQPFVHCSQPSFNLRNTAFSFDVRSSLMPLR